MEKKDVIGRLNAMLNALNAISVSGKANVLNLGGCIALTEEIIHGLSKEEEKEEQKEESK